MANDGTLFDFGDNNQWGGAGRITPHNFATPVARGSDPLTSWFAADSIKDIRPRQRSILNALARNGPLTDEEIARMCEHTDPDLKQSPSGYRTRRAELVELGLVEDSLERGRTISGRLTIKWKISTKGAQNETTNNRGLKPSGVLVDDFHEFDNPSEADETDNGSGGITRWPE